MPYKCSTGLDGNLTRTSVVYFCLNTHLNKPELTICRPLSQSHRHRDLILFNANIAIPLVAALRRCLAAQAVESPFTVYVLNKSRLPQPGR